MDSKEILGLGIKVPWARTGSAFTLLFEQAAMALVREMPVNAAARIIDITAILMARILLTMAYVR